LESHDLESFSPLAFDRLVHSVNDAIYGDLFQASTVSFLTTIRVIVINQKSSKPQTPTSTIIKCCQLTCFPCIHVRKRLESQSLTQTRAPTLRGAADKHKHTHVRHMLQPPWLEYWCWRLQIFKMSQIGCKSINLRDTTTNMGHMLWKDHQTFLEALCWSFLCLSKTTDTS